MRHLLAGAPNVAAAGGIDDPTDIAGLQLWLDASDSGTITQSSGAVSQWNDKSGNARHVASSLSQRPTTGTRTQNGLNVIDFDGAEDQLTSGAITLAQPITVFVVALFDNPDTGNRQVLGNSATNPTIFTNSGNWRYYAGTEVNTGVADDTSAHTFSVVFSGASSQMWIDGASISTGNPGTGGWSSASVLIGSGTNNFRWDGWIAEVVVYNTALSTSDRQDVEDYLKTKWGTP